MPRNRLRVCTAQRLLPAKTDTRISPVVLIYLKTHERRHMRYSLLTRWKEETDIIISFLQDKNDQNYDKIK